MSKPALAVATLILAGCASTAEWRALQIDGSSETAFGESLARIDTELSYSRSQMFALALVDIANTQVQTAVDGSRPTYTEQQLRCDAGDLTDDMDQFRFHQVCENVLWANVLMYDRYSSSRDSARATGPVGATRAMNLNPGFRECWDSERRAVSLWGYDSFIEAVESE